MLWELVHVFFDHRGLLAGREARATHDAGASSFLYPFLSEARARPRRRARRRPRLGAGEGAARSASCATQTLGDNREVLVAAAGDLRARFDAGGRLLALGNGGSATDAMDVVADFRSPPARAAGRRGARSTSPRTPRS